MATQVRQWYMLMDRVTGVIWNLNELKTAVKPFPHCEDLQYERSTGLSHQWRDHTVRVCNECSLGWMYCMLFDILQSGQYCSFIGGYLFRRGIVTELNLHMSIWCLTFDIVFQTVYSELFLFERLDLPIIFQILGVFLWNCLCCAECTFLLHASKDTVVFEYIVNQFVGPGCLDLSKCLIPCGGWHLICWELNKKVHFQ